MKLDVATLARLSPLMDEAIDLNDEQLAAWMSSISANDADLIPALQELLSKKASLQTNDILQRGPEFTAPGAATDLSDFKANDTVGSYRVLRELGRGGMGEVWLAERIDGSLKRQVALKLPHSALPQRQLAERFARERDILAALAHPNIARLYDAGIGADGQPYLALEYIEGQPITVYADANKLDVRARILLLRQVMDAVQYAHANLVIHRDLKPGNVLVTAEGKALLLDFGIAKLLEADAGQVNETELTRIGGRALTLNYAAPEQIAGSAIGIHADVWALGVLLYELVTGQRPFEAADLRATEQAVLGSEPLRPSQRHSGALALAPRSVAADLDTIVFKSLKKPAVERYATVGAFTDDLDRLLHGEPVLARPDTAWYRTRKFVERHKLAVTAAVSAVAALAAFTVSLDLQVKKVTRERDRADRIAQFMGEVFKVANPSEAGSGKITARELLDTATTNIDAELSGDPELRAGLVRTMARAYTQLGAFAQSETLLHKEIDNTGAALGHDSPATLALESELVRLHSAKFEPKEAEAQARRLLSRQRQVLGPDSMETVETESNLAGVLDMQGRFDEAAALQRHAIDVSRDLAQMDAIAILEKESKLGMYMVKAGKGSLPELERIDRELTVAYRDKLGPGNPQTLIAINNLSVVLAREERYGEEVAVLTQALADGRKTLGPDHPRVRDTLNNLAAAYGDTGDMAKAESALRESIALNQRAEGENSARAAMAKFNLAGVLVRRKDKDGALALLVDAVDHGLIPDAALQIESEGDFESLRGEPRFSELVKRIKARFGTR